MSKALERLKSAVVMKHTRRTIELPDGSEFEFWAPPITLAQRARAQKLAGNDDATSFALQLLVMVAHDDNGQKLFAPGEIAELKNELPASLVEDLMMQMINWQAEEDDTLDPKTSKQPSGKTAG